MGFYEFKWEGENLVDYTKYRLKDTEELAAYLEGVDDLFVLACNKCFKPFESFDEPDGDSFVAYAKELGKNVTGVKYVDFLCNEPQTSRKLLDEIPEGTGAIVVVSCGLGIQTIADTAEVPVIAATNSLNYRGHHGMALTNKACDACAQCYLNMTGGICPVVDCAKSLVNGQCGGAKDGKCEVDNNRECAWQRIYDRLEKQGRLAEFQAEPVQVRDYSKVKHEAIREYVTAIREKRTDGYYGGLHPSENKELAQNLPLVAFPEPDTVVIPLAQHFGAPAEPAVAVGDTVKVGQLIGKQAGFISSNVHSSVSGTVTAVEPRQHSNVGQVLSVVIANDKKGTLDESVRPNKPLEELTPAEIVEIVKDKGITGMGGAGFPAYVKLQPQKPVDTVLINGCECEPYLTADHRVMLEYADDVIYGLKAMMKAVSAEKGYLVVEDNKPDAAELLTEKTADLENIEVKVVRTKYPQGAEKMLIKNVMGRKVPSGGLPADVGCVVGNASTAKAVSDAIQTGMPLVERAMTMTGEHIANPGNFMVKIGTNVQEVIDYCGGLDTDDVLLKMGGPMMGAILSTTDIPLVKGSNGIIAIDTDTTEAVECIKCGRCVDVCPMELAPLNIAKHSDAKDVDALKAESVLDCIECRCCEFICSSKIPLVTKIKDGKKFVKEAK